MAMNVDIIPPYGNVEEFGEEISSSRIMSFVERFTGKYVRPISSVQMLHPLAVRRYQKCSAWRPLALASIHEEIMAFNPDDEQEAEEE